MSPLSKNTCLLLFCLLCTVVRPGHCYAGADRTITPAEWKSLTNDKAFSYVHDTEKVSKPKVQEESAFDRFVTAFFDFLKSDAGLGLAWIAAIGIVSFIVYKLFSGKSVLFGRQKKVIGEVQEQDEEDLATTNWDKLIQQAAAAGDYRLSIRYSYMRLLQLLQQNELIRYRNDKTNYDYYTELNESNYKQPFKQLSRQYEYAWYGHYMPAPEAYKDYMGQFNNLKKQLGA